MQTDFVTRWFETERTAEEVREGIRAYVQQPFGLFTHLFQAHVHLHPQKTSLICGDETITFEKLEDLSNRIAARLQAEGVGLGGVVSVCASTSIPYIAVFLGVLKTGAAVSPLSPSATAAQLLSMLRDSGATHLFLDRVGSEAFGPEVRQEAIERIAINDGGEGEALASWLPVEGTQPASVEILPETPFNIIYSSGTTGTPKGIVQPHSMRWPQLHLLDPPGYGPEAVCHSFDAALLQHDAGQPAARAGRRWHRGADAEASSAHDVSGAEREATG